MNAGENLIGSAHVQTPLLQRTLLLGGIAGNAHVLIVATINVAVKAPQPFRHAV
jgi:hypothetical protein